MRFLLLIGAVIWHVACLETEIVRNDDSKALRVIKRQVNIFEREFDKRVAEEVKGNLAVSAPSAWMVLSMAASGAVDKTKEQMRKGLHLPKNLFLKVGFETFATSLNKKNKAVEMHMANKMFIHHNIRPKPKFRNMTRSTFGSEIQNVNFSDSAAWKKTINDWLAAQTNNRINTLMKPAGVNSSTAMILVSAAYFKGTWKKRFFSEPEPRPFHLDFYTTVHVPTMCRRASFNSRYLPDVDATFVKIPLKSNGAGDPLSMFIVLPSEVDGLEKLESNIDKLTIDKFIGKKRRKLEVCLPEFKIESEISLNSVLKKMGMKEMFTDFADFCGIFRIPLFKLSDVVQKTVIEVAKGHERKNVPAPDIFAQDPLVKTFMADHPFLGFIAAPSKHSVKLFSFRYTGPPKLDPPTSLPPSD